MSKQRYLLDVNVLYALTAQDHIHHKLVKTWFYASKDLQWGLNPFTEAGYLRTATASRPGQVTLAEATAVIEQLKRHPGYHYLPISADWQTLCKPFFKRLYGTKQVTDAYLLGVAIREEWTLTTLDKGIVHLAGEDYRKHVLLLGTE